MERKLLGKNQDESLKQKRISANSLINCKEVRYRLRQCFRTSLLGYCGKEQADFWECFNKVFANAVAVVVAGVVAVIMFVQ